MTTDTHVRRTQADYAAGLSNLLPQGSAWPREPDSVLMKVVTGLAGVWGNEVDRRAADLLENETDPRRTIAMLPEWERAFGLPDACNDESQTLETRRAALLTRMLTIGEQDRAFFYRIAALLGYTIRIVEYSPVMAGVSQLGDTRSLSPEGPWDAEYYWEVGPPEIRFYWKVRVLGARLDWFRVGGNGGECGVDPMVRISLATDLECLFRRWKPAHTQIVFDYGSAGSSWLEYVWFRCAVSHCGVDHMLEFVTHTT